MVVWPLIEDREKVGSHVDLGRGLLGVALLRVSLLRVSLRGWPTVVSLLGLLRNRLRLSTLGHCYKSRYTPEDSSRPGEEDLERGCQ